MDYIVDEEKHNSLCAETNTQSNTFPMRNAMTSDKKSRTSQVPLLKSIMSMQSFQKELQEAANEPLEKLVVTDASEEDLPVADEEINRCNEDSNENESVIKKSGSTLNNVFVNKDLGVMGFKTPARTFRCNIFTPLSERQVLPFNFEKNTETPGVLTKISEVNGQKVQCRIDMTPLLKTPARSNKMCSINNAVLSSKKLMGSVQKLKLHSHPSSVPRLQTKCSKAILQLNNRNHENIEQKVQFSMPLKNDIYGEFSKITVKNVTYMILDQLGKGGSSVVYHCYDPITKAQRAVKRVNLDGNDAATAGYVNEVRLLHKLQNCDRIITMFDYEIIESEKLLLVVLEKGDTDLTKVLKDLSNTINHLPMYMLIYYWMEMLQAVKQIHDKGIVHSDLKPANFLIVKNCIKLIDFGIAACIPSDMTSAIKEIPVGSFNYISPEALNCETSNNCDSPNYKKPKYKITYKSDVWSLGCILYQLVYKRTPFQHMGHMWAKLTAIVDPNHKIEYPKCDWAAPKIINIIKSCLQYDVKSRPSVDALITHMYDDVYC